MTDVLHNGVFVCKCGRTSNPHPTNKCRACRSAAYDPHVKHRRKTKTVSSCSR